MTPSGTTHPPVFVFNTAGVFCNFVKLKMSLCSAGRSDKLPVAEPNHFNSIWPVRLLSPHHSAFATSQALVSSHTALVIPCHQDQGQCLSAMKRSVVTR